MFGTEIVAMAESGAQRGGEPMHIPVLPRAVVELFRDLPAELRTGWIVDATVGLGGHAELLLESLPGVHVLGVDHDPEALEIARGRLSRFEGRVRLRRARFSELARQIRKEEIGF